MLTDLKNTVQKFIDNHKTAYDVTYNYVVSSPEISVSVRYAELSGAISANIKYVRKGAVRGPMVSMQRTVTFDIGNIGKLDQRELTDLVAFYTNATAYITQEILPLLPLQVRVPADEALGPMRWDEYQDLEQLLDISGFLAKQQVPALINFYAKKYKRKTASPRCRILFTELRKAPDKTKALSALRKKLRLTTSP